MKINDFLKKYLVDAVIIFACAVYVVRGVAEIDETGKTIAEIIGDGLIAMVFGYSISQLMNVKGLMIGKESKAFERTLENYASIIEKATPFFPQLESWCDKKNENALKRKQAAILRMVNINYADFINADFDISKYEKSQKKIIDRARKAKIKELTPKLLTSESKVVDYEPYNYGKSQEEYLFTSSIFDIFLKVFVSAIFGYYGLKMVDNFSWNTIIWYALQTGAFLMLGTIKFISSYFYAIGTLRNRYIRKMNDLHEFYNEVNNEKQFQS